MDSINERCASFATALSSVLKGEPENNPKRGLAERRRNESFVAADGFWTKTDLANAKQAGLPCADSKEKWAMVLKPSKLATPEEKPTPPAFSLDDHDEYKEDFIGYMDQLEKERHLPEDFLAGRNLNIRNRAVLVDWLIHVHLSLKCEPETLSLTVSLLDRALRKMDNIRSGNLQLLGAACLYVACKFEECRIPWADSFVQASGDSFTESQLIDMEKQLLCAVDFKLFVAHTCQRVRLLRRQRCLRTLEVYGLARFIAEVPLVEYSLAHLRPSLTALVAAYLAHLILGVNSKYGLDIGELTEAEFLDVARRFVEPVLRLADGSGKLNGLHVKYTDKLPINFTDEQKQRLKDFASQSPQQ